MLCIGKMTFWKSRIFFSVTETEYGAPFVKILYLTDLAQKLLSLRRFSYLCAHTAISAQI